MIFSKDINYPKVKFLSILNIVIYIHAIAILGDIQLKKNIEVI